MTEGCIPEIDRHEVNMKEPITRLEEVIPMDPKVAFLLGMVGALAPEIVRLYSIRNNPTKFKWSWFYLVVSILFACLGGIFAFVLTAATYYSALYIGISTPVLINTVIKKGIESSTSELKQGLVAPAAKYSTYRSFVEGLYL